LKKLFPIPYLHLEHNLTAIAILSNEHHFSIDDRNVSPYCASATERALAVLRAGRLL